MTFKEIHRAIRRWLRKNPPAPWTPEAHANIDRAITTIYRAAVDAAMLAAYPSMVIDGLIVPGPWMPLTVTPATRNAETDEQNYYSVRARLGLDCYRTLVRNRVEALDLADPTAIY